MSSPLHRYKIQKFNLLQFFRGVSALLVLMVHATRLSQNTFHRDFLANTFYFGFSGVDFFFVLSGFIIYYIHYKDIGYKSRFKIFVLKRFIRIYPFYWIVTIFLLVVNFLFSNLKLVDIPDSNYVLKSFLLYPQEQIPILSTAWTLCHEIKFYIMFSFAILFNSRFSKLIITFWISGTLLISIIYLLGKWEIETPFLISFLFNSCNLEFVLGCLAAYLIINFNKFKIQNERKSKIGILLLLLGILAFSFSGFTYKFVALVFNYSQRQIIKLAMYGVPSALIIIGATFLEISKPVHVPYILLYLGNASYSIYLTHVPSLLILKEIVLANNLESVIGYSLTMSSIVLISLSIGCAFHAYVEQPLLAFFKQKIDKNQ